MNGPVHRLACASPWISCVMGRHTVQRERMKLTALLGATAVSTITPLTHVVTFNIMQTGQSKYIHSLICVVRYLEMCLSEL